VIDGTARCCHKAREVGGRGVVEGVDARRCTPAGVVRNFRRVRTSVHLHSQRRVPRGCIKIQGGVRVRQAHAWFASGETLSRVVAAPTNVCTDSIETAQDAHWNTQGAPAMPSVLRTSASEDLRMTQIE
jgi:hypothetical protein